MMINDHGLCGKPLEPTYRMKPWLIATVSITREQLLEVLSEPHCEEHDPTRTAGGSEDHWAFEFEDGQRIGIIFRRPYDEASIFADPPDVPATLARLEPLLTDRTVKTADTPILLW